MQCVETPAFLSTLSLRRATKPNKHQNPTRRFLSTLSLRRATAVNIQRPAAKNDFYPRSPCGERRRGRLNSSGIQIFLSTLSLRRATPTGGQTFEINLISIHALLAESDTEAQSEAVTTLISIHALLAESDNSRILLFGIHPISIHALLAESDALKTIKALFDTISIHALLAESDPRGCCLLP